LAVGPLNEGASQRERFEKFCDWESTLNLEVRVPDAAAQTVSALFYEDFAGDVDYFQLAPMEEFKSLEFSNQGLETGGAGGPLADDIVGYHVIRKVEHLVVSETRSGDWFLS
jgi:hypothetical protein